MPISLLNYFANSNGVIGVPINAIKSHPTFDSMLISEVAYRDIKLPSSYCVADSGKMDKGADVFPAQTGNKEWIIVLDFSQHYPRIMVDFNTGVDAVRPKSKASIRAPLYKENGEIEWIYYADPEEYRALLPSFVIRLMELRWWVEEQMAKYSVGSVEYNEYKELKDAVKGRINSIYGINATSFFRLRNGKVASTVTSVGRKGLHIASDIAEKHGLKTIYGHTDSVFFRLPKHLIPEEPLKPGWYEPIVSFIKNITDEINIEVHKWERSCGVKNPTMNIEAEDLARTMFMAGKKNRYVMDIIYNWKKGDITNTPLRKRWKIRGFETRRSNASAFTKTIMFQMFEEMLTKPNKADILKWLHDEYNKFIAGNVNPKLIYIPIGVRSLKPESKAQHIRAVFYGMNNFGWKYGGKCYMVYVKQKLHDYQDEDNGLYPTKRNPFKYPETHVLALPSPYTKLPEGFCIDWKTNANTRLLSPLVDIIDTVELNTQDVKTGCFAMRLESGDSDLMEADPL